MTESGDEQILTVTDKDGNITSGYNLNGSFTMITGQTAAMGTMNDFNNYAVSQWGNKYGLGFEQAKSFSGWMESARAKFGGIMGTGTEREVSSLEESGKKEQRTQNLLTKNPEKIKTALDEYNFTKTDISESGWRRKREFKASQKGKVSMIILLDVWGVTATTPTSTFSMVNRPSYEDPYASVTIRNKLQVCGQTDDNEDFFGTGGGGRSVWWLRVL